MFDIQYSLFTFVDSILRFAVSILLTKKMEINSLHSVIRLERVILSELISDPLNYL